MGRYRAYPEYREASVEWLGKVPLQWEIVKTSWLYKIAMGQTILREDLDDTGDWPVYSATEGDHFFGKICNPIVRLVPGDIVIPARGNSIGFVKLVKERSTATQTTIYCKAINDNRIYPGYAYYYMLGKQKNLFGYTNTAIPQLTVEDVSTNPLLVPTLAEQVQITAFLDHETAKIDRLIAKQEELIALLKEKRQAVISHAVTKGLNPDAPMKDSGVEWLGEIPAHWKVKRIKQVSSVVTSGPRGWSDYISDEGEIFIQSGDLNDSLEVALATCQRVNVNHNAESMRSSARNGDVIVCITGAKTGRVAVVNELNEPAYINQHLSLVRPMPEIILPSIIAWQLSSSFGQSYLSNVQYGLKEGLNLSNISNAIILVPPIEEQKHITSALLAMLPRIDSLISKSGDAINLQQERRTALISAAVTGKIDVRDWKPTESSLSLAEAN